MLYQSTHATVETATRAVQDGSGKATNDTYMLVKDSTTNQIIARYFPKTKAEAERDFERAKKVADQYKVAVTKKVAAADIFEGLGKEKSEETASESNAAVAKMTAKPKTTKTTRKPAAKKAVKPAVKKAKVTIPKVTKTTRKTTTAKKKQ